MLQNQRKCDFLRFELSHEVANHKCKPGKKRKKKKKSQNCLKLGR